MRPALLAILATVVFGLALVAGAAARPTGQYHVQQDVLMATVKDWKGRTVQLGVDLYAPRRHDAPILVWLHGGGFFEGVRREGEAMARAVASNGVAVASIDYRLRTTAVIARDGIEAALVDAEADVATAFRFLRRNAKAIGIAPDAIAVGGHSAGALVALRVAAESTARGSSLPRPCMAVSVAGGIDVQRVRKGMPPVAFFHADLDPTVRVAYALEARREMAAKKVETWWVDLPGEGHVPADGTWITEIGPKIAKFVKAAC